MPQDTSYPDPAQLRSFAADPNPFTNVEDISLQADGHLVGGAGNVEYDYQPSYIRFSPESGGTWEIRQRDDATLDHAGCWSRRAEVETTADFICVTGFTDDMVPQYGKFDAFWILHSITIDVP